MGIGTDKLDNIIATRARDASCDCLPHKEQPFWRPSLWSSSQRVTALLPTNTACYVTATFSSAAARKKSTAAEVCLFLAFPPCDNNENKVRFLFSFLGVANFSFLYACETASAVAVDYHPAKP